MIDNKQQIAYWIDTAKSDLDTAELLIRECRFLHGLFFCHLAIERELKHMLLKPPWKVHQSLTI